jgi:apolipoprotein N-acyltransferase
MVPGRQSRIIPGEPAGDQRRGARAGVAICKDMHFAALGREHGRAAVALMLVPPRDFDRDGWIADRMTALRGVESGYAVVAPAATGSPASETASAVSSLRRRATAPPVP